ncbi:uncharacterized protein L201_004147 [Kwoniella dendrophila CBS 6074]|uniref:Zn(2)-C6 fungal-type domain-containing protein n=1 Tax=Kwoniella dendrophila CBS 6074 TaxID=1295534 RepID=A0AAX4JWR3_9TREE
MNNSPYSNLLPPDRRGSSANPAFPRLNYGSNVDDNIHNQNRSSGGQVKTEGGGSDNSNNNNHNNIEMSGENRNFPQNSQATLPAHFEHFSTFGQPPLPPPLTATSTTTGILPLPLNQSRTLPPNTNPSHSSYNNAPHFRSSPHGYPETMQQLSSPITPHRYDYPLHSYHATSVQPSTSSNQQGGGAGVFQPWQLDGNQNSRRRESMPDMINKDNSNPLFSHRPMLSGSTDSRPSNNMPGDTGNNNNQGLQQYVHSLTGLVQTSPQQPSSSSSLGLRAWQPMTSVPPPSIPSSSFTSTPPAPVPKRKRSRASTFGSRTTDEDEGSQRTTNITANNGTDDNDSAHAPSGNKKKQPHVTSKDFTKQQQPLASTSAVKAEGSDEIAEMDVEHGQDGDEKIDHRKRKRNRTIRSCVPCHNHKRRCDRKRPCGRCTALGLTGTCVYEIDEARDINDPDVIETDRLRRRIAELEQVVRELRQKAPTRAQAQLASVPTTPAATASTTLTEEGSGEDKKRRVIVDRFARFKLDEAKDVENSAAAAGSRSITPNPPAWAPQSVIPSRSGNLHIRSNIDPTALRDSPAGPSTTHGNDDYKSEPYQTYLLPGEEMSSDKTGRKVFLGVSTGKSMLRRLRELAKGRGDGQLLSVPEDIAFTGVFPDLRKTYPFTTIWSHESFSAEIIGLLPSVEQAELLWQAFSEEHGIYFHPFHMPTVHAEYTSFFAMSATDKMNVPLSSLALHLMICALGCVIRATTAEIFGHPDTTTAVQGGSRKSSASKDAKDLTSSRLQSELYLSASFQALRLCAFLANPTIRSIQAQLLQMVYLLASERAADAWTTAGTLVKQAIAIGLHKDPLSLDPKISMRDAEVRRRLWWSLAGFDCMLCIFFGRPSTISYYSTNLPQDRPDANLSELPGSAQQFLPPSNVLSNETTEQTYHAAYYQLTIPSFELLDRIFTVDRRFSRSTIYGWFSPPPKDSIQPSSFANHGEDSNQHTYQDAIRLANDIGQWYSHLPSGMKFNENDTAEYLLGSRNRRQLNQTLILSMKTWTIVMILHRPYLRLDPTAYPESTEICAQAAHSLLRTYKSMADTKSSLAWSFWTMPYRAFQAGAVCAFLAMRQPGTELADKCLTDLRAVIRVFEDRLSTWNITHPVQADLCEGLVQLEKLITAANQQRNTPQQSSAPPSHSTLPSMSPNLFGLSPNTFSDSSFTTPLSQIQAFPSVTLPASTISSGNGNYLTPPMNGASIYAHAHSGHNDTTRNEQGGMGNMPGGGLGIGIGKGGHNGDNLVGQMNGDFNGPEPLALPQLWANMFGIKMAKDKETQPLTTNTNLNSNPNVSSGPNW